MSADDEKKVKLDELPDEGSEPKKAPPKKPQPKPTDPRVEKIKKLDDPDKVIQMEKFWRFDVPDWNFSWVPWFVTLALLEFTGFFQSIKTDIEALKNNPETIGPDIFLPFLEIGAQLFLHPLALAVFFPFFFKLKEKSPYEFTVTFDGLKTVKEVLPYGSTKLVEPIFLKWDVITSVEKKIVNNKEVLRLGSRDGNVADLIWHLDLDKKRALKLLLNGMIHPKHAMRVFLDNEQELKI